MTAQLVAGEGCCHPVLAAWRADGLGVQFGRDLAGVLAIQIVAEDPPHDFGFFLDDLQLSGSAEDGAIAIGAAAGMPAVARHAFHATAHLVREILQVEGADQAANADLHLVGNAVMDRADLDAGEGEALIDAGEILLVAAETVKRLDDQHVELTGAGGIHHGQEAIAPHDRCAGSGAVVELVDDGQAIGLGVATAKGYLILYGSIALQVG